MKKIGLLFVFIMTFISCSTEEEVLESVELQGVESNTASRLSAGKNVSLYKYAVVNSYTGVASQRVFQVEVRDLAYHKDVAVLHKMADGSWKFFQLNYKTSLENGTQIWETKLFSNYFNFGSEFAVRYIVDGVEYWDNNDGSNYAATNNTILKDDVNVSVYRYHQHTQTYPGIYSGTLRVEVDLKNLAYHKQVTLLYTKDNWNTVHSAPFQYVSSGANNIERWKTPTLNVYPPNQNYEFVVVYTVDGVEYWDNNFGQNYNTL